MDVSFSLWITNLMLFCGSLCSGLGHWEAPIFPRTTPAFCVLITSFLSGPAGIPGCSRLSTPCLKCVEPDVLQSLEFFESGNSCIYIVGYVGNGTQV
jgi:hypothetical protein